jgi:hypothetical protein
MDNEEDCQAEIVSLVANMQKVKNALNVEALAKRYSYLEHMLDLKLTDYYHCSKSPITLLIAETWLHLCQFGVSWLLAAASKLILLLLSALFNKFDRFPQEVP